jgi:16S rRNA (cytidine1402-2'-O)-methyltransferase
MVACMGSDIPLAPGLYIVATPIGNLGDISARALRMLAEADVIAAEDTRVTGKLLKRMGIGTPMVAHHAHNEAESATRLLARLAQGARVALVSDAGTPVISDPGFALARAARAAGHLVTGAPGPCAAIMALTLSGLPAEPFLFAGFLPPKAAARATALAAFAPVPATLVFHETAPRLAAALAAMADALGNRDASVARELTKLHEEVATGSLRDLASRFAAHPARGEIVVVVGPPAPAPPQGLDAALADLKPGAPIAAEAARLAAASGLPRRRLYAEILKRRAARPWDASD